MKKFLLPLITALSLPTAGYTGVDPEVHNLCKDVSDYMGCVKANTKKEGWNPFKKSAKEKKSKNSFQLSKAQKEEWCDYGDYNEEYMKGVNRCIENLETLGPKFLSISFDNHTNCVPVAGLSPYIENYITCLKDKGDEAISLIATGNKIEEIKRVNYSQRNSGKEEPEESKKSLLGTYENFGNSIEQLDRLTFKGKTYTASRSCPAGEKMYWQTTSGFMRKTKVSELGCMTASENEEYWRNIEIRKAGAPKGGGGSGSDATTRMNMQTEMQWNNINRDYQRSLDNYQRDMGY